jgi:DNA-binding transcriptional MerR regulator
MTQRAPTSQTAKAKAKTRSQKATAKATPGTNKKGSPKAGAKGHAKDRVTNAMSDEAARAALDASDKLYYRIGEVSELTAVKAHVLRYWETEFRWMAPPKSRSKQRLYRKRDIEFVWLLKRLLWDERYTIAGARQRIQELGVDEALKLLAQPVGGAATDPNRATVGFDSFKASIVEMRSSLVSLREGLAAPL